MTSYLLLCACGAKNPVTASQAGQEVRCTCGAILEVPTLRGLAELASADSVHTSTPPGAWEDRHRTAFLFVLLSLCAGAVGGYLLTSLPNKAPPLTAQEIETQLKDLTPQQLLGLLGAMEKGIAYLPPNLAMSDSRAIEIRQMMLWGAGIAAVLVASSLAAAAAALLMPKDRPR